MRRPTCSSTSRCSTTGVAATPRWATARRFGSSRTGSASMRLSNPRRHKSGPLEDEIRWAPQLSIDYRGADRPAVLTWAAVDESAPWFDVIKRLVLDSTDDARQEAALVISVPWWNCVALRNRFGEICAGRSEER